MAFDLPTLAEAVSTHRDTSKGTSRKTLKGRKDRREHLVEQQVRATVVVRDGDCRLFGRALGVCGGESEWAHLDPKRRFQTRGLPPEERHTTKASVMFCTTHHQAYDAHRFDVVYLTPDGADGPLKYYIYGPGKTVGEYSEPKPVAA